MLGDPPLSGAFILLRATSWASQHRSCWSVYNILHVEVAHPGTYLGEFILFRDEYRATVKSPSLLSG